MASKGTLRILQRGRVGFYCPACDVYHVIPVINCGPNNPMWEFNEDYDKPTFYPSINVESSNENGKTICHSFVTDGKIQFLGDCTHSMAGMTVELSARVIR